MRESVTRTIKTGIRDAVCINDDEDREPFIPQPHQEAIKNYFLNSKHGLLLYHLLGSGKTCTSIMIADAMLKAGKVNMVYVCTQACLRGNFLSEYCNVCGDRNILHKKYRFITFNTTIFQSIKSINFNNSLVIIDEAPNLINGVKNISKNPSALYNQILDSNARVLLLSATVIYSQLYEWCLIGNLLKRGAFPNIIKNEKLNIELFELEKNKIFTKEKLSGIISYFEGYSTNFPEKIIEKPINILMTPNQSLLYNEIYSMEEQIRAMSVNLTKKKINTPKDKKDRERILMALKYIFSRSISNVNYIIVSSPFEIKIDDYDIEKIVKTEINIVNEANVEDLKNKEEKIDPEECSIENVIEENNNDKGDTIISFNRFKKKYMDGASDTEDDSELSSESDIQNEDDNSELNKEKTKINYNKMLLDYLKNIDMDYVDENFPNVTDYIIIRFLKLLGPFKYLLKKYKTKEEIAEKVLENLKNNGYDIEKFTKEQFQKLMFEIDNIEKSDVLETFKKFRKPDISTKMGGWISKDTLKNKLLTQMSPKIISLILNILKYPNSKHAVFSYFLNKAGIKMIHNIFKMCKIKSVIYSGNIDTYKRVSILKRFNSIKNRNGAKIKIFLSTEAGSEGITLKEVEHLHILETNPNANKDIQTIGRAVRYKSHEKLPKDRQKVHIWRYFSQPIKNVTKYTDYNFLKSYEDYYKYYVKEGCINTAKEHFGNISIGEGVDEKLFYNNEVKKNNYDEFYKILKNNSIENTIFSDKNQIEKENMILWFKNLSDDDKNILSFVSALYSYHFDGYLNNIYKNKEFSRLQLINHAFDLIRYPNMHSVWIKDMSTDPKYENIFCNGKDINESPFYKFNKTDKIKLSEYIKEMKKFTFIMHQVMINPNFSYILQNDITVYRALRIKTKKDIDIYNDINLEIMGVTSVTTELDNALQFAFTLYGKEDTTYDEREYKSIVLKITLPKGTRVIPISICSIHEENELLIISQGKLYFDITKNVKIEYCKWWNKYYNKKGEIINPKEGNLPYLLIETIFEINPEKSLEYIPDIKISEKVENIFDDVVIDDI